MEYFWNTEKNTSVKNAMKAFEAKPLTPDVGVVVCVVAGVVVGVVAGVVVGVVVGVVAGVVIEVSVGVGSVGSVGASVGLESQSKFSATKPFLLIKLAKYRAEFFGTLGRSGSVKSM